MRSSSGLLMRFGSQITPPLPPPNGMFTVAVFQVIHIASAFTSSERDAGMVANAALGWARAPRCAARDSR